MSCSFVQGGRQAPGRVWIRVWCSDIKLPAPRGPLGLSEKLALLKQPLLVINNISGIPGCQMKGICRHSAVGSLISVIHGELLNL